jgi:hypothetical protein
MAGPALVRRRLPALAVSSHVQLGPTAYSVHGLGVASGRNRGAQKANGLAPPTQARLFPPRSGRPAPHPQHQQQAAMRSARFAANKSSCRGPPSARPCPPLRVRHTLWLAPGASAEVGDAQRHVPACWVHYRRLPAPQRPVTALRVLSIPTEGARAPPLGPELGTTASGAAPAAAAASSQPLDAAGVVRRSVARPLAPLACPPPTPRLQPHFQGSPLR